MEIRLVGSDPTKSEVHVGDPRGRDEVGRDSSRDGVSSEDGDGLDVRVLAEMSSKDVEAFRTGETGDGET